MRGQSGARVKTVEGVRLALAALEIEVPAIIIGDIGMPGEDGLSMIRKIRQRSPARGGVVPAMPADVLRAVDGLVTRPRATQERRRARRAAPRPMPADQTP